MMRTTRLAPWFLGALMVLPAVALPTAAQGQDEDDFFAERLAEVQAQWAQPSSLDAAQAARLLDAIGAGEAIPAEQAVDLLRFLRDAPATDAGLEPAVRQWAGLTLQRGVDGVGADAWQQGTWDTLGTAMTVAYLAAAPVAPGVVLPHDLRIPGLYLDLSVYAGCTGNIGRGYCYAGAIADILALVALNIHLTSDSAVLQLPLAIEIRLNWSCGWTGCRFWFETLLPESLIATNAQYVFAYPFGSGEFASRVTDSDILQMAYDRLGGIAWQKPREVTAAAPLAGTPVDAQVPGGTPGLSDLHAVAPAANYYGLQVPPEVPGKPPLPALPSTPAPPVPVAVPVDVGTLYAQPRTRVRDDFGTVPVDSAGVTAAFTMSQIRAWHLNIAILRWKNIGTGTLGELPEAPASFYYDAGSYFTGGGLNQWAVDDRLSDALV